MLEHDPLQCNTCEKRCTSLATLKHHQKRTKQCRKRSRSESQSSSASESDSSDQSSSSSQARYLLKVKPKYYIFTYSIHKTSA